MVDRKRLIHGSMAIVAVLALAACGRSANTATSAGKSASAQGLSISSWGPQSTKAGEAFNVQPGGAAALWIRVNRSLDGDEASIDFNDTLLPGNISGNLVTATVPAPMYATSGTYNVQVVVRSGTVSSKSNVVAFTVK